MLLIFSGCFLRSLVQRERRSLRIHQLRDTAATGHVHWTVHDFGAILCRPAERSIEIGRIWKPLTRRSTATDIDNTGILVQSGFADQIEGHVEMRSIPTHFGRRLVFVNPIPVCLVRHVYVSEMLYNYTRIP